jgi:hypothetical protein
VVLRRRFVSFSKKLKRTKQLMEMSLNYTSLFLMRLMPSAKPEDHQEVLELTLTIM